MTQTRLEEVNNTDAPYPHDTTIQQLFAHQVVRTPDHLAAIYPGKVAPLTYADLNAKANSLAHLLREKGVGPGIIVAIMVERSLEMIIGIFGIIKAGGAYLPIDPGAPGKRLELMLKDSAARLVLTQAKFLGKLAVDTTVINLDDPVIYLHGELEPEHLNHPNDPVYVIYTSGSTGVPKGVVIEHHALLNRLNWMQKNTP